MLIPIFLAILLSGIGNLLAEANTAVSDETDKVLAGQPVKPPHSRPYVAQVLRDTGSEKEWYHGIIYDAYTIITTSVQIQHIKSIMAGKYYLTQSEDSQQARNICMISKYPNNIDGMEDSTSGDNGAALFANDFAVLHLSDPLVFNEFVQNINLAPPGAKLPGVTTACHLISWGRTTPGASPSYSSVLRERPVIFMDPSTCPQTDPSISCLVEGGCHYDWGAPVVCNLKGVPTVYAYATALYLDCTLPIMAWVAALPRKWFNDEIEKAKKQCRSITTPVPPSTPSTPTPPPTPPPPSTPTPHPPPPPPPPPGQCECSLKGYCKMYFECIKNPNGPAGWEYRGNCTANLYWNPNNVTGGFCDYFQNLPAELQVKYRSDPTCFHCEWFQEIRDVCSPRYTFRDENLVEHKMSCPPSPSGLDPLYWQLNSRSCDLCYFAVDHHGVPCQC